MRIALLGATGRTGGELMKQAPAAGHEVVAHVRRTEALGAHPSLTVVGSQLDDTATLTTALVGGEAVAVTLGPKISEHSAAIMQTAIPAAITSAKATRVNRVVVLCALGVGETFANSSHPYRFGCRTFLAGNFRDHDTGESQLAGTGLTWTTAHPGPLCNRPRTTPSTCGRRPRTQDARRCSHQPGSRRGDDARLDRRPGDVRQADAARLRRADRLR